jgi:uncharacterized protein (DUF983 family)
MKIVKGGAVCEKCGSAMVFDGLMAWSCPKCAPPEPSAPRWFKTRWLLSVDSCANCGKPYRDHKHIEMECPENVGD